MRALPAEALTLVHVCDLLLNVAGIRRQIRAMSRFLFQGRVRKVEFLGLIETLTRRPIVDSQVHWSTRGELRPISWEQVTVSNCRGWWYYE